ncbi:hypothetical protein RJ640_009902 [Escallonia rubra]|uniref:Biogenesis of lysosome-related organelles complex 1 subunit 2 n=1 Tax=Escallonia rubra TaxID=112253 RepID=A0AA88UE63_9ASTE|nr:hypothetical protein RJ640_009902 [Escallonia rubra]
MPVPSFFEIKPEIPETQSLLLSRHKLQGQEEQETVSDGTERTVDVYIDAELQSLGAVETVEEKESIQEAPLDFQVPDQRVFGVLDTAQANAHSRIKELAPSKIMKRMEVKESDACVGAESGAVHAERYAREYQSSDDVVGHDCKDVTQENRSGLGDEQEELTEALSNLFTSVSTTIKGELKMVHSFSSIIVSYNELPSQLKERLFRRPGVEQATNNLLELLEKMNIRVAEEYKGFGDVASGLRVFVEQLKCKSGNFDEYVQQIDIIEKQVTEFEAVISMLDKYVSLLETEVQSVYRIPPS